MANHAHHRRHEDGEKERERHDSNPSWSSPFHSLMGEHVARDHPHANSHPLLTDPVYFAATSASPNKKKGDEKGETEYLVAEALLDIVKTSHDAPSALSTLAFPVDVFQKPSFDSARHGITSPRPLNGVTQATSKRQVVTKMKPAKKPRVAWEGIRVDDNQTQMDSVYNDLEGADAFISSSSFPMLDFLSFNDNHQESMEKQEVLMKQKALMKLAESMKRSHETRASLEGLSSSSFPMLDFLSFVDNNQESMKKQEVLKKQKALMKLAESMKRSHETRASLKVKSPALKLDRHQRRSIISAIASTEESRKLIEDNMSLHHHQYDYRQTRMSTESSALERNPEVDLLDSRKCYEVVDDWNTMMHDGGDPMKWTLVGVDKCCLSGAAQGKRVNRTRVRRPRKRVASARLGRLRKNGVICFNRHLWHALNLSPSRDGGSQPLLSSWGY